MPPIVVSAQPTESAPGAEVAQDADAHDQQCHQPQRHQQHAAGGAVAANLRNPPWGRREGCCVARSEDQAVRQGCKQGSAQPGRT